MCIIIFTTNIILNNKYDLFPQIPIQWGYFVPGPSVNTRGYLFTMFASWRSCIIESLSICVSECLSNLHVCVGLHGQMYIDWCICMCMEAISSPTRPCLAIPWSSTLFFYFLLECQCVLFVRGCFVYVHFADWHTQLFYWLQKILKSCMLLVASSEECCCLIGWDVSCRLVCTYRQTTSSSLLIHETMLVENIQQLDVNAYNKFECPVPVNIVWLVLVQQYAC